MADAAADSAPATATASEICNPKTADKRKDSHMSSVITEWTGSLLTVVAVATAFAMFSL